MTMVGFGPKQAWLAIREGDPGKVLVALGLRDLGTVPWRDGIDLAYFSDDRVMLTPLLPGADGAGWLLVTGRWLLRAPIDVVSLSAELDTEVQRFVSYRVEQWHGWQRAVSGELIRAFEFVDEVVRSEGVPEEFVDREEPLVGEADVLRMAGEWSVDPARLDGRPEPGPLRAAAA